MQECDDLDDLFQDIDLSELDDPFDLEYDTDVDDAGVNDADVDDTDGNNDDIREYSEYDSDSVDEYDTISEDELNDDDADNAEMDMSFSAPPYSPISPHYDQGSSLENTYWRITGDQIVNGSSHSPTVSDTNPADSFNHDADRVEMDISVSTPNHNCIIPYDDQGAFLDTINWDVIGDQHVVGSDHNTTVLRSSTDWKGFKIVGDNVDKNIKPSLQRYDNKTNSLHYFHYYAVMDRLDLSQCPEVESTNMINLQEILVSVTDVSQLECDSITLIARLDFVKLMHYNIFLQNFGSTFRSIQESSQEIELAYFIQV